MEFLKFFITEEIYILPDERAKEKINTTTEIPEALSEKDLQSQPPVSDVKKPDTAPDTKKPAPEPAHEVQKQAPLAVSSNFSVTFIVSALNEEQENLLKNIIDALKITPSKIHRVSHLKEVLCTRVVAFGHYPELQNFPSYQVIRKGGKQLLISDDLSEIAVDVGKKKRLWEALKQMFAA